MRTIKFRGRDLETGKLVYGDLMKGSFNRVLIDENKGALPARYVEPESVGQFTNCYDADGTEIYEGDYLEIDYEGAEKAIGKGFLICDLKASKPTPEAQLRVEYHRARFELVWRTKNGGCDTGVDMFYVPPIKEFVRVSLKRTSVVMMCARTDNASLAR